MQESLRGAQFSELALREGAGLDSFVLEGPIVCEVGPPGVKQVVGLPIIWANGTGSKQVNSAFPEAISREGAHL